MLGAQKALEVSIDSKTDQKIKFNVVVGWTNSVVIFLCDVEVEV